MVTVNSHRRKRHTSLRTTHKTTKFHWFCANVHLYCFLEHLFSKPHPKPHLPKMHFRKMQSQPSTHNAKRMNFHSKLIRTTQKCTKNSAISAFECATDWALFPVQLGHHTLCARNLIRDRAVLFHILSCLPISTIQHRARFGPFLLNPAWNLSGFGPIR